MSIEMQYVKDGNEVLKRFVFTGIVRLDPTHETEYALETFVAERQAAGFGGSYFEIRWGEIWSELCTQ